jgi:FMN phosphatase YigB (HAD superfamily)
MKDSVILVDADGVLLNWEYAFEVWMEQHGFEKIPGSELHYDISKWYGISRDQTMKLIRMFNESAAIGFLPPLRDAMYYIEKLHKEHGYVFHCITSVSVEPNAMKLREMNLRKLFGETAFQKVVCLDTGAPKDQALWPYRDTGCYWVEDKVENAEHGAAIGLTSLLMEHGHNMHHFHENVRTVKNWRDIYEIITDEIVED